MAEQSGLDVKVAVIEERLTALAKTVEKLDIAVAMQGRDIAAQIQASSAKASDDLTKATEKIAVSLMGMLKEQAAEHRIELDRQSERFNAAIIEQKKRIDPIVKWIAMVMGGLIVVGFLLKEGSTIVSSLFNVATTSTTTPMAPPVVSPPAPPAPPKPTMPPSGTR